MKFKVKFLLPVLFSLFALASCEKQDEILATSPEVSIDQSDLTSKITGAQWLQRQENNGGRTLSRHFDRTNAQLQAMINGGLATASTFRGVARDGIGSSIRGHANQITSGGRTRWQNVPNGTRRSFTFNPGVGFGDLGHCMGRTLTVSNPMRIFYIIDKRTRPHKMLAAYPVR